MRDMIKENQIWKVCGTDYKNMTKELLEATDLAGRIPSRSSRICIKPNLVCPTPADYGATTHPEVVAGIIEYLQEREFRNLRICEGSWVGDRTPEAFEYCGYNAISEKYGVPLTDLQQEKSIETDAGGMRLRISDIVGEYDFLINVPVLKGHCQTKVTCALKNLKGMLPNSEKSRFHKLGLHRPIAHLQKAIHQDFIVVDHICGDLDFEEGGNPVTRNCIMAARDPVLVDAYVCSLLGYETKDVPYVGLAGSLGVGSADLNSLRLVTCEGEAVEDLPRERKILAVSYAVDDSDSCSACYGTLIPALERLRQEGLLDLLAEPVAIGQGHRGKTGRVGVGNCTALFDFCIKGCPPSEEDIYQGIKQYLDL